MLKLYWKFGELIIDTIKVKNSSIILIDDGTNPLSMKYINYLLHRESIKLIISNKIQDLKKATLDSNKFDATEINIIIPDTIYSINPSFFEELFLNVVLKLGRDKFLEKFKFQSSKYLYEKP